MSKSHANVVSFVENVSYLLTLTNLYETKRNEHFLRTKQLLKTGHIKIRRGYSILGAGLSTVTQQPLALTMFSCNFATLQDVCLCNMGTRKAKEQSLRFVRTCVVWKRLVLTTFNKRPIIASSPTCFISRLLSPRVWPQVSFDCSMMRLSGMRDQRKVNPSINFASTHLYTWVERGGWRMADGEWRVV